MGFLIEEINKVLCIYNKFFFLFLLELKEYLFLYLLFFRLFFLFFWEVSEYFILFDVNENE